MRAPLRVNFQSILVLLRLAWAFHARSSFLSGFKALIRLRAPDIVGIAGSAQSQPDSASFRAWASSVHKSGSKGSGPLMARRCR